MYGVYEMSRKRKCKYCKEYMDSFITFPGGVFCNMEHAVAFAREKAEKQREKALKKKEQETKKKHAKRKKEFYNNDRAIRTREAQKAFNAFIRERDGKDPCISCGRYHEGQWHAGHYRSTGAHPELRFEELNCHKQCSVCNNHKSGNIAEYRIELIKRIGLDKVEWLEGPHEPTKYTCEELKEIELHYKAKLKKLKEEVN